MANTAVNLGCEAVQIFSRSPRGGKARALDSKDVEAMKSLFKIHSVWPLIVHVPYFVNLGSLDPVKSGYSVEVLAEDLVRAETLGAKYVVTHIGHREKDEPHESPDALKRVLSCLGNVMERYRGPAKLLLENTAGQGRELGSSFKSVAFLLDRLPRDRVGACFDTCHAFGAGYDLSTPRGMGQVLTAFDDIIGLDNLGAIHVNDSKGQLNSHVDRHEHVGKGSIGEDSFRALLQDARLPADLPGLLETPLDKPGADRKNLDTLKRLRDQ